MTTTNERTLALRMTEGKIPVPEALHLSMSLAEALRKLHDAGKSHGAVTPASIVVTAAGLELIPSLGPPAAVTPYTAPEVLLGQPADARSDIFSFGALVFEMLTGRRAFEGESQTALTMALSNAAPPSSGSPAVDRLVAGCVAKSPTARWQRMQKIILELKLLTVAARRADSTPPTRGASDAVLRSEMQQLEARLEARLAERLAAHEKAVAQAQNTAGQAVQSLREQLTGVDARLTAVQDRPQPPAIDLDALTKQFAGQVEETVAEANRQHEAQAKEAASAAAKQLVDQVNATVAAANQRMAAVEQNLEEIRKHFSTLQVNVAADLHDFEQTLKTQATSIDSARTAMAQTDDLVERVVEALELLQSSVLEQHAGAVN